MSQSLTTAELNALGDVFDRPLTDSFSIYGPDVHVGLLHHGRKWICSVSTDSFTAQSFPRKAEAIEAFRGTVVSLALGHSQVLWGTRPSPGDVIGVVRGGDEQHWESSWCVVWRLNEQCGWTQYPERAAAELGAAQIMYTYAHSFEDNDPLGKITAVALRWRSAKLREDVSASLLGSLIRAGMSDGTIRRGGAIDVSGLASKLRVSREFIYQVARGEAWIRYPDS
jgi:hypothetical protein